MNTGQGCTTKISITQIRPCSSSPLVACGPTSFPQNPRKFSRGADWHAGVRGALAFDIGVIRCPQVRLALGADLIVILSCSHGHGGPERRGLRRNGWPRIVARHERLLGDL